jgi:Domain of unknown function (DUF4157)
MKTRMPVQGKAAMTSSAMFTPVRGGLLQRKCVCGGTPGPTGECEECRKKRLSLQRKTPRAGADSQHSTFNTQQGSDVPPIVHEVLNSPGRPLDPATRAFFEPRFGHDFSEVRVHTDARAAESARAVNALAFTVGRDVVFGQGHYAPGKSQGKRLLAHELTHVLQQGDGPIPEQLYLGDTMSPSERHADLLSRQVVESSEPGAKLGAARFASLRDGITKGPKLIQRAEFDPVGPDNAACQAKIAEDTARCLDKAETKATIFGTLYGALIAAFLVEKLPLWGPVAGVGMGAVAIALLKESEKAACRAKGTQAGALCNKNYPVTPVSSTTAHPL